ncbi:MurR/RpiR family transcriptional regulator [Streptomyces sp. NBC_01089]|uniref:MurR/RpiR family transcriptional regulator n=1 Tax=Streptomyces sp. NBC_01089 TaxID=2903747 RepID=UPI00386B14AE|nr:MurR/RpiR family transcriptional regulator [Streptomyces sp. NBC_01089]
MTTTESGSGATQPGFHTRVAERLAHLSPAERQVAEYLRNHVQDVPFATAEQLGQAAGTSDATVVRTAKALGYSGLPELKRELGQRFVDSSRPSTVRRRTTSGDSDAALDQIFDEAVDRLQQTRRLLDTASFGRAVDLLAGARGVTAFGVGASELSARHLALRLGRLGFRTQVAAATGFQLADALLPLTVDDVVVVYAPGRLLTDVEVVLDHAARTGAASVLVTDSLGPVLGDRVDVALTALYSSGGLASEELAAITLNDALLLAVQERDAARASEAGETLNRLRESLTGRDPAVYVPRRRQRRRGTGDDAS